MLMGPGLVHELQLACGIIGLFSGTAKVANIRQAGACSPHGKNEKSYSVVMGSKGLVSCRNLNCEVDLEELRLHTTSNRVSGQD